MKERPVIFSASMVKALLAGTKTQTRRIIKNPGRFENIRSCGFCSPYGQPRDRLWVRETWADVNSESGPAILYRADNHYHWCTEDAYPVDYSRYPGCQFTMWCGDLLRGEEGHAWRTPIFMPRWASRITLEIEDVRVQQVREITYGDVIAEGLAEWLTDEQQTDASHRHEAREAYGRLFDKINGAGSWAMNPWVWALTLKVIPQ